AVERSGGLPGGQAGRGPGVSPGDVRGLVRPGRRRRRAEHVPPRAARPRPLGFFPERHPLASLPVSDVVISVRDLSKRFKLYTSPWDRVIEWINLGRVVRHETFWALQAINLEVMRGECVGIIGVNGAGKSTLLKVLSRALYPTTGHFEVKGRLVSLLELGTGFH